MKAKVADLRVNDLVMAQGAPGVVIGIASERCDDGYCLVMHPGDDRPVLYPVDEVKLVREL